MGKKRRSSPSQASDHTGETNEGQSSKRSNSNWKPAKEIHRKQNNELDPFEIEFQDQFLHNRGPREAFVNEHNVVIGDYDYESEHSPLEQWSEDTDPAVMAGSQWVHPFKDIGFQRAENKAYFEHGKRPMSGIFMHPDQNVTASVWDEAANADLTAPLEDEESTDEE